MIYLSASSIRDFIRCSKMFFYRKNYPEESVDTDGQVEGKIVHKLAELHWDGSEYTETLKSLMAEYGKDPFTCDLSKINVAMRNMRNEFPGITQLLTVDDLVEYEFSQKIGSDVTITGKIDRIIKNQDIVLDWKTTTAPKKNIDNDVQFIIYYTMYKRIFGREPLVYQINLMKNTVSVFRPNKIYIDTLYDSIIPKIVDQIKKGKYYKEGYFNGGCYNCSYISVCAKNP